MRTRILAVVLAALSFGAVGGVASAQSQGGFTVEGFVADQQCVGGDFVQVTLSATVQPSQPAAFRWDLNNDSTFDTRLSRNPTVQRLYPDETNVTVRVGAINRSRQVDTDVFSFRHAPMRVR